MRIPRLFQRHMFVDDEHEPAGHSDTGTSSLERPTRPEDLVDAFLSGLKPTTIRSCAADLQALAAWLDAADPATAAQRLLADQGNANLLAHRWRADMLEAGLAPNIINRHLSANRGLIRLANRVGMIGWTLSIPAVKAESYRDTRGPGRGVVIVMLGQLSQKATPKAACDWALLRLPY